MNLSREKLLGEAKATGFRPDMLEKAIRLLALLEALRTHPFLKGKLALKGGTALNLFVFEVPRLSVDIDLNYVGSPDREVMTAERPRIEQAVTAVCQRQGFEIRRMPDEHAGGKFSLRYQSALGAGGNLEVDINFLLRVPLWPVVDRASFAVGSFGATKIPVLDLHELAAGKLAALMARHASRDLFDAHALLKHPDVDPEQVRIGFVVYGGLNRKDWREVSVTAIEFEQRELEEQLLPLLRGDAYEAWRGSATRLMRECRKLMKMVLPLRRNEKQFLDRLLDHGEILPTLLTDDSKMVERIGEHPGLKWKALNVRQHKGGGVQPGRPRKL